jgi:hypothetical protein
MKNLALFLGSCILAGTVHAVDVTKAEAATKIKTLPATISAPGYYYLSPSINPVVTGLATAITITASNVVLDLNGINIVATNGIFINGTNSRISFVTIQNGSITASGFPSFQPTSAINLLACLGRTIDSVNIDQESGASTENGITDNLSVGDVIKNCFIHAFGSSLILNDCSDVLTNTFFVGNVQSTITNVFKNNTFFEGTVQLAGGDLFSGNAFISASHTGGIDIAGQ